MADDDHSVQPRCHHQWHDSRGTRGSGGRGGSYSDTTTVAPHGSDRYTLWPLYLDPWIGIVWMWPGSAGGGRRPVASPISHAGRCSPLWSSSAVGRPDLCATPGASTFSGVDTVDDPRQSHPRSPSAAGRPDHHFTPGASTSGGVDTLDGLQRSPLWSSSVAGRPNIHATPGASITSIMATVNELLEPAAAGLTPSTPR
jgi:hypothetical protein